MSKKKILCIIGRSGSGKTTIERLLDLFTPYHYHSIVSYTTRPMRPGETDGVEHHFVKPEQKPDGKNMLAYTKYGNYEYWADKRDVQDDVINTYVIDVEGYHYLKRYYSDEYDIKVAYVSRHIPTDDIDISRRIRDYGREELSPDEIDVILNNDTPLTEQSRLKLISCFDMRIALLYPDD